MPVSDEGNALIKNLQQFKEYGIWTMLTEFVEIKWNKRACNSLLKTIRETTRSSAIAGRPCDAKACQGLLKWTWK